MKIRGPEKWIRVALGLVCGALVINLALQLGGMRAGASRGVLPAGKARAARLPAPPGPSSPDELSRYDPVVRLDLLKKLESRKLPEIARDPFASGAPRAVAQPVPAAPSAPPPPPPPPPIPLKALGYSEKNGRQEAFVGDDEQTYVVHEGETFAQRYRVVKITPQFIEIVDESSHQTAQLPFAQ